MTDTFISHRILNPIQMKKYVYFRKKLIFFGLDIGKINICGVKMVTRCHLKIKVFFERLKEVILRLLCHSFIASVLAILLAAFLLLLACSRFRRGLDNLYIILSFLIVNLRNNQACQQQRQLI